MESLLKKLEIDEQFSTFLPNGSDDFLLDYLINDYNLENPNEIPFISKLVDRIYSAQKKYEYIIIDYKRGCIDSLLAASLLQCFFVNNKFNSQINNNDIDTNIIEKDFFTIYIGHSSEYRYRSSKNSAAFTIDMVSNKVNKIEYLISGKLSKNDILKSINLTTLIFYFIRSFFSFSKSNKDTSEFLYFPMISIILKGQSFNKDERAIIKKSLELLRFSNNFAAKKMLIEKDEISYDYIFSIKEYLHNYLINDELKTQQLFCNNNLSIPFLIKDFNPIKQDFEKDKKAPVFYIWQINQEAIRFLKSLYPYTKPLNMRISSISNYLKIEDEYIKINNFIYVKNNIRNLESVKSGLCDIEGFISIRDDKLYLEN